MLTEDAKKGENSRAAKKSKEENAAKAKENLKKNEQK
jgi:hypothetical protein